MPRVAFQGEFGAFSDEAIEALFGPAERLPRRDFAAVVDAVRGGDADYGVLPVRNSTAGPVPDSLGALAACPTVQVVATVTLPVRQCLLAAPGVAVHDLEYVESHPVALAQCGAFLGRHPHLHARPAYDTAGAARDLAARADRRCAAIAGRGAAARYGLAVLVFDIQDDPDNRTEFVAIATDAPVPPRPPIDRQLTERADAGR